MKKKTSTKPDWEAIRRACEKGDRTIAEIARSFNVNPRYLYRKRREWRENSAGTTLDHLAMVRRLYNATDQQIRHLETRLQSGTAAFDEKEARMLGTIARTLDKIMELSPTDNAAVSKAKKKAPKGKPRNNAISVQVEGGDDETEDKSNLDALRKELAQRIDRLQQGRKGSFSGDT